MQNTNSTRSFELHLKCQLNNFEESCERVWLDITDINPQGETDKLYCLAVLMQA